MTCRSFALILMGSTGLALLCSTLPSQAQDTPAAGAPGAAPPTTQVMIAADQSTPRGAIKLFKTAQINGDAAALERVIDAPTPEDQKVIHSFAQEQSAEATLRHAFFDKLAPAGSAAQEKEQMADLMAHIDTMEENIAGEQASVGDIGAPPEMQMKLHRVGGMWKVPFAAMFPNLGDPQKAVAIFDAQRGVMEGMTRDLNAGKFKDAASFQQALQTRATAALKPFAATQPSATTQP